jgi:hypothetical protein
MLVFAVLFLFAFQAFALDQPRMRDAIGYLKEAKASDQPLVPLEKARHELQEAARNKKGWRVAALQEVNEAIGFANSGDKQKMIAKIDHAIADIWTGIDNGKK